MCCQPFLSENSPLLPLELLAAVCREDQLGQTSVIFQDWGEPQKRQSEDTAQYKQSGEGKVSEHHVCLPSGSRGWSTVVWLQQQIVLPITPTLLCFLLFWQYIIMFLPVLSLTQCHTADEVRDYTSIHPQHDLHMNDLYRCLDCNFLS